MYESETRTIETRGGKSREASEVWCYRRMLKINWVARITNEKVLDKIKEKRMLWNHLRKRTS